MALEQTGWETTVRWAWRRSVDIQQMLEDLAEWLAASKPDATNLVTPETPLLNEVAREAFW